MANYAYQCRDSRGEMVTGTIIADTVADAGQLLRSEG